MSEQRDNEFYANQLKPCPFCGGKAEHGMSQGLEGGVHLDRWEVGCADCGASLIVGICPNDDWPHSVVSRAVERWNRRSREEKDAASPTVTGEK